MIDVHAHFFNGSDVPVRGFIGECLGHNAPPYLQPLMRAMARLGEAIAGRAPTARQELDELLALAAAVGGRSESERRQSVDSWFDADRRRAAQNAAEIVRGSEFERRYRELDPQSNPSSAADVFQVAAEARTPRPARRQQTRGLQEQRALGAKAQLEFLVYMVSKRASNLRTYIEAFAPEEGAGVDMVLGSLVDFDYWLDCPPRSAHDDQLQLHQQIAAAHGGFMKPVAAYNPWTDINQSGAGLTRILNAWRQDAIVAVKIYPPTGFMPADNALVPVKTSKRRPDLRRLDGALAKFFDTCAEHNIPVIAHAARSNGRDNAHDDFSSPVSWTRLLRRYAAGSKTPILDLGHFGGDDGGTTWTLQFAQLMKERSDARIFADIGYWDQLMCDDAVKCRQARERLKTALAVPITSSTTVADRVMFGTDWLMSSQITDWQEYPARVREALRAITSEAVVDRILGQNALECFARLTAPVKT